MNANVMKACVLGIVLVMLGTVCVVAVPTEAADGTDPGFKEAPESGWTVVNNFANINLSDIASGNANKSSINGIGIQSINGTAQILIRNAEDVIVSFLFDDDGGTKTAEIYIEGDNNIKTDGSGTLINGTIDIYIAEGSNLTITTVFTDQKYDGIIGSESVTVIGQDRNSSTISFECSGTSQNMYSAALRHCDGIYNATATYHYDEADISENPNKVVNPGDENYSYANMCHKVFIDT